VVWTGEGFEEEILQLLELVLLVNCEGHLFVAGFVAVADTLVVD